MKPVYTIAAGAVLAFLLYAFAPTSSPAQPAAAAPRCLQVNQIENHTAISDREILFFMTDNTVWKNTLRAECPGLKFENGFSWDVTGGEVCANNQVIHVLSRGTPCQLGAFSLYQQPAHS